MNIVAPGRICLFGEHQDYLGLPVITMAISLFATISSYLNQEKKVTIKKSDINETESFFLNELICTNPYDYFKSGMNICIEEGLSFSNGFDTEITSDIPIQAGCGSSSSIIVGWIKYLSQIADKPANWNSQKIRCALCGPTVCLMCAHAWGCA